MLQFSLARLFVSIGLIASGFAAYALIQKARIIGQLLPPGPERHILAGGALIVSGSILVIAGVGNLFKKPLLGAAIGFVLVAAFFMIVFAIQEFTL